MTFDLAIVPYPLRYGLRDACPLPAPFVHILNRLFIVQFETADGALKTDDDWQVGRIAVGYGASLGAGCVVLPDVSIGRFAMVGAGAVVTRSVPDHGLVRGNPARLAGYVCACGQPLIEDGPNRGEFRCPACQRSYQFTPEGDLA